MLAAVFKMGYRVHCATQDRITHASRKTFELDTSKEVRLVLVGKTGGGKSETGNTILGHKRFLQSAAAYSLTKNCEHGISKRFGRTIIVVDTPGFKDTELGNKDKSYDVRELMKCTGMVSPGPHAFLFVIKIGQRFGKEDEDVMKEFQDFFGQNIMDHTIVVFTGADSFDDDPKIRHIDQYIETLPKTAQNTLNSWKKRSIAFNNKGNNSIKEQQVKKLLNLVDNIAEDNDFPYYTSDMLRSVENALRKSIYEELQKEHVTEHMEQRIYERIREEKRQEMEKDDPDVITILAKAIIPHVGPVIAAIVRRFFP